MFFLYSNMKAAMFLLFLHHCNLRYFILLISQAAENLGMAMVFTLVTSAKEWLSERFAEDAGDEDGDDDEAAKDEVLFFPRVRCVYLWISCIKR